MNKPNTIEIEATAKVDKAKKGAQELHGAFDASANGIKSAAGRITASLQVVKSTVDKVKAAIEENTRRAVAAYQNLNDKIKEAISLELQHSQVVAQRLALERQSDDADLDLDEANELAAVDPSDPDAAAKRSLVSLKYQRIRSQRSADRASEDRQTKIDSLLQQADEKDAEALRIWKLTDKLPLQETDEDYENFKKMRTQAEAASKAAKDLRAQADETANTDVPAITRNKATQVRLDTQERDINLSIKNAQAQRAQADADRIARQQADAQRKADADAARQAAEQEKAARLASAQDALPTLTHQAQMAQDEINDAQRRKDEASLALFNAQGAYDLATANRRNPNADGRAALAQLQTAKDNAARVNAESDALIREMSATLASLNAKIRAATAEINRQSAQQSYAWADAPAPL